ncbi:MAG: DNA-directed RNA polymerase subunit beta' [Proteobacteria bacterium]|nr:DNA-directed RNA polymerase subunit beta' [Pseudomonadota bacterium]
MANVMDLFKKPAESKSFDGIQIKIASSEEIRQRSFGEIKKPETINYRTFKPEFGGLFCSRIFGPIKDYECLCGKYKRMKHRGIVCEKCGVEVIESKVRRERMGHIELAAPVAHIWYLKLLPSKIATILDTNLKLKNIEKILYFEGFIVIDPGMTGLEPMQILSEEEYMDAQDEYGEDAFHAEIGAEAIRYLLKQIDLEKEVFEMEAQLAEDLPAPKRKDLVKRLKIMKGFYESGNKPEDMILDVIPVLPPELRPLVPLEGGRFATSDLNDLYRRVVNRNNRLKRLLELRAPEIIVRNEKRMLQEAVDALFDNGRRGRVITGANRRPLKSLAEMLKGKQGRFRQNLLGKRVDYSGRSVITVGPELLLHQCGLPKKMALELFKPFVFNVLEKNGHANTIKIAKKLVDAGTPEVWDALEEVIREHPVLLNRAPTLHRLGIQAFEPKLIEGKAIQLHPLTCAAFNADFDGDQMAVHIPLSLEAQIEARVLMMSTNNLLKLSNGEPIISPSQDIILGLYYLSMSKYGEKGEGMVFSSLGEMEHALAEGLITYHTIVKCVFEGRLIEANVGRFIIAQALPKHEKVSFNLIDKLLTKKEVTKLLHYVFLNCGEKATCILADRMMQVGFKYAAKAGISFGMADMEIPDEKYTLVDAASKEVERFEQQYMDGLITSGEKYNKVIDIWTATTEKVTDSMMDKISDKEVEYKGEKVTQPSDNSVYIMATSGARGSKTQMRQLAGMRGLMAKPNGEIIETPITANFREGLTVLQYFISTHGARKGLADTALKTANSGYLTRRLVDVSQDCVVTEDDCGTEDHIVARDIMNGTNVVEPLKDRILGRTLAEDVVNPVDGKTLGVRNEIVNEKLSTAIEVAGLDSVKIRSALFCETKNGICAKCYGRDMGRLTPINIGEAVGVIAAQSIGEPGTQLTMRTFHVGGTASGSSAQNSFEASYNGKVKVNNATTMENSDNANVVMSRNTEVVITEGEKVLETFKIDYGSDLKVKDGDEIKAGETLAQWDPFTKPILVELSGKVQFMDITDGLTMKENVDETTGMTSREIVDWKHSPRAADLRPSIALLDEKGEVLILPNGSKAVYMLPISSIISVKDGETIKAGDAIARMPQDAMKSKDITGGLPRVAELFEARKPKDSAIISEIDGIISFGKDLKSSRRLYVKGETENGDEKIVEYQVPKGTHINVREGDTVKAGDMIMEGNKVPQDILRAQGLEALSEYMIREIQEVYRLQGVEINDKHIEVILKQMLRKVEIIEPGNTTFISGDLATLSEVEKVNAKLIAEGKVPARFDLVLQGITKASLTTDSFISAASFQETTRVLTDAAVSGKIDNLEGLKENVIVGRLIPAGTGKALSDLKKEIAPNTKTAKIA